MSRRHIIRTTLIGRATHSRGTSTRHAQPAIARTTYGNDDHLGPVGSRIVAETLVGLIDSDPSSYRIVHPDWTPTLPNDYSGGDDYRMADLLDFAVEGGYTHPGP